MKILGKAVLIKPDSPPPRTKKGLLLSHTAMDKYVKGKAQPGTVMDVGYMCKDLIKGQRVLFPARSASAIVIDNVEYYLITEDKITYIPENNEQV